MFRIVPATTLCALLAACAPPPVAEQPALDPFGDAAARREAALTLPRDDAARIAADTRAALGGTGVPFDPLAAPGAVVPVDIATLDVDLDRDNPSISTEQDFEAVSAERGIEADAERLRQAREQRQEVAPVTLERPDDVGPNIFAYALGPARPVGSTGAYGRGIQAGRGADKCTGYSSAELAQEAFLEAGGPERDRLGLDPDGDGNACGWDPATVRSAVGQ